MKTKLIIEVENCSQCPYVKVTRTQGAGYAFNYSCSKYPKWNNVIATYVEYDDELDNTPPEWCPCRLEESNCEVVC